MQHVNKKSLARKENLVQIKNRPRLNYEWKPIRKKSDPKKSKETVKIKLKLTHVNKKPLARMHFFVQTPFPHSTLKLERKNFTPQNHSLFHSTSCFGVTKITNPIWLQN